jgi:hypothetical protein
MQWPNMVLEQVVYLRKRHVISLDIYDLNDVRIV